MDERPLGRHGGPREHTRLRRLVSAVFATRAVEGPAPRVTEPAHDLIGAFIGQGRTGLVASCTTPLPITVILELLGCPRRRARTCRRGRATS
ncbi:hypothetical protein [Streptomyces glaucus]|uniref:Uncharacterized protein n=1 Tax=Streptomyces glaucus TaxID=284029 RepID=A0ABP5WT14_9ACTN